MAPDMQLVGRLEDSYGLPISVSVDFDGIRLQVGGSIATFGQEEAEEFAQLFVSACWETGRPAP